MLRVVVGCWLLVGCLVCGGRITQADERDEFFESRVRPVLVEKCFRCHGGTQTSGKLRVDGREALVAGGESGPAIVPGRAEESLLIRAIQRQADVSPMPPDGEPGLRGDQVQDLVRWVKSGAVWPAASVKFATAAHWAFQQLRDVAVPEVQDARWSRTSIDPFIRAAQERVEIDPSPPADKWTLIRRATFDLTGLPPTAADVDAFLRDDAPDAFARVVERLLASPAYGEKWGRHWLDVVRYADTAGETADYPAPLAWRYRNWVIDAYNADRPYDEFVREQLAGDILAGRGPREQYAERAIATGYLAISRRFGFDSENYHHLTIQDTIDTLGQSLLGLTLGCARCHDHKYDTVTMTDYYGLYGIFDSSRYAFPGSEQKQKFRALLPLEPPEEVEARWRQFHAEVAAVAAQLEEQKQSVPTAVLRSLNDIDGDFELQAPAAGGSNGVLVPPWQYTGQIAVTTAAQSPYRNLSPRGRVGASIAEQAGAYRIEQALYPQRTAGNTDRVYVNLDFRVGAPAEGVTGAHRFRLGAMSGSPAVEIVISSTVVSLREGEMLKPIASLPPKQWTNLQLTLDLRERTVNGTIGTPEHVAALPLRPLLPNWSGMIDHVALTADEGINEPAPAIEYDNLGVQTAPIGPVTAELPPAAAAGSAATPEETLARFQSLLAEGPVAMAYGMSEGTPHNVRMQLRGEPGQPGDEVPRGFIHAFGGGPLPAETTGSGRLELAEWLTRPDHPLTARVMVNRIWQQHFGRGLVATPNDFGVRGQPPTHPELLDHLAREFIRSGWSIKALHRLIVLSATYQQAAVSSDEELYASFTRRRLSAEEIRDAILMVSGELDPTPGEGHPFPPPAQWGYTQHSPFSAVYDHHRRSVYLMTQRLKRHPFLALFDGADPNASTADRLETTVPTQALFFLNDPFVHASAEHWAGRLLATQSDDLGRIDEAWWTAIGRGPTEIEAAEGLEFLAAYRAEAATEQQDGVECRALAAYLRTLIGGNEFVHVD